MPPFLEPRPRREDIPEDADPADILHELRLLTWEWRYWRHDVNGDLAFLRRFRSVINDTARALVVLVPVAGVVLAALVAFKVI